MTSEVDIAIIGAGIVGLAVGLELAAQFPSQRLAILEKETTVAGHQTSHNSGVVHSGIYYRPGSLKAKLCVEGAAMLLEFCRANNLPLDVCGKVIVATDSSEFPRMEELYRRGHGNGLSGLRLLSGEEIREIEPHAAGLRGIHVPGTAIVDYKLIAMKYAELIMERGGAVLLGHKVVGLKRSGSLTSIETDQGPIHARLVVNCAGLQSDRVSRMADAQTDLSIIPFRGEYYEIAPEKANLVKGLIYPVPDPEFPFLGVHFTRRVGGGVEAGPNAVLAWKREGYTKTSFAFRDALGYAAFPGFWIMGSKYWRMSVGEYYRSWNKKAFTRALQRLIPALEERDLVPGGSGVRAQAVTRQGKLVDDFSIKYSDGMVHVRNVPSPAATASLAIAKYIVCNFIAPLATA